MSDTTMDPRAIAQAAAIEVADEDSQVGDFVEAIDLGDNVTDFRFETRVRGYEGWQWSVTLYHDVELDHWTVNESSLVPTDKALRPPEWIPWKDRLEPTDLAVTDSIGTDPDDPRMEEGFRKTEPAEPGENVSSDAESAETTNASDNAEMDADGAAGSQGESAAASVTSEEDIDEAVEEFDLSRRHVLTSLGRSQTAKRWYEGPRGPKSLSTKTSDGNPCSTCGFFIPLKGELNLLFGVCANKWSPDDGRVVSLDHGCGEHSEIEPPEPSQLWVQSKPAFDDLHIDVVANRPRKQEPAAQDEAEGETDKTGEPAGDDIEAQKTVDGNAVDTEPAEEAAGDGTSQSQSAGDESVAQNVSDSVVDVDAADSSDDSKSDADDEATEEDILNNTVADDDEDDEMDDEEDNVRPSDDVTPELETVIDLIEQLRQNRADEE